MFTKSFGKSTSPFTVLYKVGSRHMLPDGRYTDNTIYTFTCAATDAEDAVRLLRHSLRFTVKRENGVVLNRTKNFKVVTVYSGTETRPVEVVDTEVSRRYPEMGRKVTILPSKMPGWMKRNHFGKGR